MLYILQFSKYVFPLITFPYLTRVLQPTNYGIMTFANAVMAYFHMLVDFGFLQSATRDCSLYRNDKYKLGYIVTSVVQAKCVLSLVGFVAVLFLVLFSDVFSGKELYLLLAYIPVFLGVFGTDYLFRGLEVMTVITFRTIVGRTIYTALIFIFVRKSEHYLFIPVISSFGEVVISIWTWHYIKDILRINIKSVSWTDTLDALRSSSMFFISRIATTAYSSTNIIVLGLLYDSATLAQFGVANSLIGNIRSMFSPIADSLYPYMIQKKNYKLVKKSLLFLMPIISLIIVCLYFLANGIVTIMSGENYLSAVPIFRALLPVVLITLPVYLLGFPVLGAMNRMNDVNYSTIVAGIYHLLGLLILYTTGNCNFISIAFLTFSTELVVFTYRAVCVVIEFTGKQKKKKYLENNIA